MTVTEQTKEATRIDDQKLVESLFDALNAKHFKGVLKRPVIVLTHDCRGAYGRFTYFFKGNNYEGNYSDGEGSFFTITLNMRALDNETNVCLTLLHELCHYWNMINCIQDTSNGNNYHNEKFKTVAERVGLKCEKVKTYGWTTPDMIDDMKKWSEEFFAKAGKFKYYDMLYRGLKTGSGDGATTAKTEDGEPAENAKKPRYRYTSPNGDISFTSTKTVDIEALGTFGGKEWTIEEI